MLKGIGEGIIYTEERFPKLEKLEQRKYLTAEIIVRKNSRYHSKCENSIEINYSEREKFTEWRNVIR